MLDASAPTIASRLGRFDWRLIKAKPAGDGSLDEAALVHGVLTASFCCLAEGGFSGSKWRRSPMVTAWTRATGSNGHEARSGQLLPSVCAPMAAPSTVLDQRQRSRTKVSFSFVESWPRIKPHVPSEMRFTVPVMKLVLAARHGALPETTFCAIRGDRRTGDACAKDG